MYKLSHLVQTVLVMVIITTIVVGLGLAAGHTFNPVSFPTHRQCNRCENWLVAESTDTIGWCITCEKWLYLPTLPMSSSPFESVTPLEDMPTQFNEDLDDPSAICGR